MRKSFYLCAIFAIIFSCESFAQINKEADYKFKEQRKQWYNDMHYTRDSMNWRVLNYEIRNIKSKNKESQIKERIKKSDKLYGDLESFAGGALNAKWIERGSNNISGRIKTADVDYEKNLLYAASDGGNVWVSSLNDKKWKSLNDYNNFNEIKGIKLLKFNNTERVFTACNGPTKCYYTDNQGTIWQQSSGLESVTQYGRIKRVLFLDDPSNSIFILANEWDNDLWQNTVKVYLSNNNGESFNQIKTTYSNLSSCDIWAPKYSADKAMFFTGDSLFSIDLNAESEFITTIDLNSLDFGYYNTRMKGIISYNSNLLFFALTRRSDIDPNKSAVDFAQFNVLTGELKKNGEIDDFNFFDDNSWDVNNRDDGYMVCGGVNCFYSYDYGQSWTLINDWADYYDDIENELHADIPSILIFNKPGDENEQTFICTDGGIYLSDDYSENVKNYAMQTLNTSQYYSTYTLGKDRDVIFAGAQDQGFQKSISISENKLATFEQVISGDYGHLVSSDGGNILWANYPGFTITFENLASSAEHINQWSFVGSDWLWLPPIIASPTNPRKAYIISGGENGSSNIWELTLQSSTINHKKLNFDFNSNLDDNKVSYLAISTKNGNLWYAITTRGNFYKSTNAGSNWTMTSSVMGAGAHYFYGNKLIIDPNNDNNVFIAGSGSDESPFYYSIDGGNTFVKANNGIPETLIFDIEISADGKWIFGASEVGPYAFSTISKKWYDISGLTTPDQTYWTVEYLDDISTARFGTYGRGIWDFKIESFGELDINTLTHNPEFQIKVSPIPAKESINICFELQEDSFTDLKIYNIEGKIIDVIYSIDLQKGKYDFSWNFSSKFGNKLPKGTYFCVLSALKMSDYIKFVID